MAMLDIPRLDRLELQARPLTQDVCGFILQLNYKLLPGVEIVFEDAHRIPKGAVLFAMNHTDRYNYFPFQVYLWSHYQRYTATWVKGKYYEHWFVAGFMERTNQLPTVSRGYLIAKDFALTTGRPPTREQYELLRQWVNAAGVGDASALAPSPGSVPEEVLGRARNVMGLDFDPTKHDYAAYINAAFHIMMARFVKLNEDAVRLGLDLLIFPQGTRAKRLMPGHIGISQIAMHLKIPVVPVGCNGTDRLYPGSSPWARSGRVVYRIGDPIHYEDVPDMHVDEEYEPFTPHAEEKHKAVFERYAALVTDRIDPLLDEEYRLAPDAGADATTGSDRFL